MKKLISAVIAVIMTMNVFVGCAAETSLPPTESVTTEQDVSPDTTASTIPDKLEFDTYTNIFSDDRDIENVFDIMNNDNVEEFRADYSIFEEYKGLLDELEEIGFKELLLYQHTKKSTIRVGRVGDVLVGQFEVREDPIVWNFRAEKADGFVNNTGIIFPAHAESQEFAKSEVIAGATALLTAWAMDDAETVWTDVWMVFFPKSGNLYTFYAENLTVDNSTRCPWVVVQTFTDHDRYDKWIFGDSSGNIYDDYGNVIGHF